MINRQSAIENRKFKAFTLIELLVVIAIISLLVSILLPSLNRAKALARRVICAVNVRNINQTFNMYANNYDGCIPVGYRWCKQMNYLIWRDDTDLVVFGYLKKADLMEQPEAFYCPVEERPYTSFDTDENPWPPGGSDAGVDICRAGYGSRPDALWRAPPDEISPIPFPKLSDFSNQAIIADAMSNATDLAGRHKDGVNVGYIDGSAHWVDASLFEDIFDSFVAYGPANDNGIKDIWDVFDEQI